MNKAVFIDKDGTLVPDIPYNVNTKLISLTQYAAKGLKQLQQQHFLLVIISNQPGVARGFFSEHDLNPVWATIKGLLMKEGVHIDAVYYCPHDEHGMDGPYKKICYCRKPSPGMLLQAAKELDISLTDSWMIGDILDDVEAGKRAGCRTILINNGNETEWMLSSLRTPDYYALNIKEAAEMILWQRKKYAFKNYI